MIKRKDAIADKTNKDTTSPMLAATGVAKLSGFIFNFLVMKMTAISTKSIKGRMINLII